MEDKRRINGDYTIGFAIEDREVYFEKGDVVICFIKKGVQWPYKVWDVDPETNILHLVGNGAGNRGMPLAIQAKYCANYHNFGPIANSILMIAN